MTRSQTSTATELVSATRPKPVQLPGPERRSQILSAARQAFMSSGLAGARVRQIAQLAGCNEALIYHYFDSKEHLFEVAILEPLQQMIAEFSETTRRIESEPGNLEDKVREAALQLIRTMNESMPLLGIALFGDSTEGQRFYVKDFYPLMVRGSELAFRAYATRLDPAIMAAIFGMGFGIAMDHWFRGLKADEDRVADVLTQFVLHGVIPGAPRSSSARSSRIPRARSKRNARANKAK